MALFRKQPVLQHGRGIGFNLYRSPTSPAFKLFGNQVVQQSYDRDVGNSHDGGDFHLKELMNRQTTKDQQTVAKLTDVGNHSKTVTKSTAKSGKKRKTASSTSAASDAPKRKRPYHRRHRPKPQQSVFYEDEDESDSGSGYEGKEDEDGNIDDQ